MHINLFELLDLEMNGTMRLSRRGTWYFSSGGEQLVVGFILARVVEPSYLLVRGVCICTSY